MLQIAQEELLKIQEVKHQEDRPLHGNGNLKNNTQNTNKIRNTAETTAQNKNVNLKEMHLNLEGLSPAFNKNTTQYYLVVSNLINDIEVKAVPEDSSCKVEITGNKNLSIGNNKIDIKVISADGSASKIYSINVSKTENKELGNASLENLAIENITLNPEFNSDIFEYTAEVSSDIENLKILAVPQRENARCSNTRG